MKHQAYFLRKIKVKKIKCHLLQFLIGSLRVKVAFGDHRQAATVFIVP